MAMKTITGWRVTLETLPNDNALAKYIIHHLEGYRKNAHYGKYTDDVISLQNLIKAIREMEHGGKVRDL